MDNVFGFFEKLPVHDGKLMHYCALLLVWLPLAVQGSPEQDGRTTRSEISDFRIGPGGKITFIGQGSPTTGSDGPSSPRGPRFFAEGSAEECVFRLSDLQRKSTMTYQTLYPSFTTIVSQGKNVTVTADRGKVFLSAKGLIKCAPRDGEDFHEFQSRIDKVHQRLSLATESGEHARIGGSTSYDFPRRTAKLNVDFGQVPKSAGLIGKIGDTEFEIPPTK